MRVSYFAGYAAHLLGQHPDVAKVETLADAGVAGVDWHPGWLKVTMTNGASMVLCVVRSASDTERSDKPDTFKPEDIDASARQMPSLQGSDLG